MAGWHSLMTETLDSWSLSWRKALIKAVVPNITAFILLLSICLACSRTPLIELITPDYTSFVVDVFIAEIIIFDVFSRSTASVLVPPTSIPMT